MPEELPKGGEALVNIKQNNRLQQGFSLVELMVVVGIIGVTIAVGGAYSLKNKPMREWKEAARTLQNDMKMAQSTAVKEGLKVFVKFTPGADYLDFGGGRYEMWVDSDDSLDLTSADRAIRNATMPKTVSMYDFSNPGSTIVFEPRGTVNSFYSVSFTNTLQANPSQKKGTKYYFFSLRSNGGMNLRLEEES